MQHPQGQADHLQILATRRGGDVSWLGPYVENDAPLQPWDEEVCAFVDDFILDSRQPVEDDGSCATTNIVDGLLCECEGDTAGDGPLVETLKKAVGHLGLSVDRLRVWSVC